MSEANDLTEKKLAELEKDVARLYSKARKGLKTEIEKYFRQFKKADEEKKAQLEAGEITQEEYKQWRTREMAAGVQFEELRDKIARDYLKTNKEARNLINESMLDVFALNSNYEAYLLESRINGN